MALIENLVIALGLRTRQFDKKLDKSKKNLSGFAKHTSGLKGKFSGLMKTAIGLGVAFVGVNTAVSKVRESLSRLDAIGKASTKLGIMTEELIALRYAAGQFSGMAAQSVDTAIQRMTRRLSEAGTGKGETINAIKELGLDAKELSKLKPYQQVLKIADAFEKIEQQSDKVRLSFKLFDTEGVAFVNLLQGGSSAIEEMYAKADKLGLLFSSEEIARVESANDAIENVGLSMRAMWDRLTIELAPALVVIANQLTEVTKSMQEMGTSGVTVAEIMIVSFGTLYDMINATVQSFRSLSTAAKLSWSVVSDFAENPFRKGWSKRTESLSIIADKQANDAIRSMSLGTVASMLARLDSARSDIAGGMSLGSKSDSDKIASGAGKSVRPGAFFQGTREAVVAELEARRNMKGATDYAAKTAASTEIIKEKATKIESQLDMMKRLLDGIEFESGIPVL